MTRSAALALHAGNDLIMPGEGTENILRGIARDQLEPYFNQDGTINYSLFAGMTKINDLGDFVTIYDENGQPKKNETYILTTKEIETTEDDGTVSTTTHAVVDENGNYPYEGYVVKISRGDLQKAAINVLQSVIKTDVFNEWLVAYNEGAREDNVENTVVEEPKLKEQKVEEVGEDTPNITLIVAIGMLLVLIGLGFVIAIKRKK